MKREKTLELYTIDQLDKRWNELQKALLNKDMIIRRGADGQYYNVLSQRRDLDVYKLLNTKTSSFQIDETLYAFVNLVKSIPFKEAVELLNINEDNLELLEKLTLSFDFLLFDYNLTAEKTSFYQGQSYVTTDPWWDENAPLEAAILVTNNCNMTSTRTLLPMSDIKVNLENKELRTW